MLTDITFILTFLLQMNEMESDNFVKRSHSDNCSHIPETDRDIDDRLNILLTVEATVAIVH